MDDFIQVDVMGVYMTSTLHGLTPVVMISNEAGEIMPIYVGMSEGVSINSASNNEITPRPMTHDLMTSIIERLDASISCVFIDEIKDGIYYARLKLNYDGSTIEIDARPSDCISLAVRTGAPIKVRSSVFQSSTIKEDEMEGMMTLDSFVNSS
ncbi:MAG: bifunctional nuclease family protein [Methanosarcinales archaeon]|nr:bifunctional nuclease family protein [Methanosarcinales archaeon]